MESDPTEDLVPPDDDVQELIQIAEAFDELPDDQQEVFQVILRVDHRIDMETVEEMIDELNEAETVGPLLNPGNWQGDAFDKSNRALERLRAFKEFKETLDAIE